MKKIAALLLVFMLVFSCTHVLAAPAREMQNMDIAVSPALQEQLNAVVSEAADTPSSLYVYAAAYDGEKAVVYGDIYACETVMDEEQPLGEGETWQEYTADNANAWLLMLPEEAVTFLYHCQLTLVPDLDAESGWQVVSCDELSPLYTAGRTVNWQQADNTEYGYSLLLPTGFALKEDVAQHMLWQMNNSSETLKVDAMENPGYDALLQDYLNAPTGEVLMEEKEFGTFSTYGDTFFEVYVAIDGTEYAYVLRLDFAPERQGEYLFYGELIRNSFFVWGGAVG